jgi:peptide/nickel transport system ATP-binding protein/oligopeptide transport system ATP-binding protein
MTVRDIVSERCASTATRGRGKARVDQLLRVVGLSPEHGNRFPHEPSADSGSASALPAHSRSTRISVLDEPVSALDV